MASVKEGRADPRGAPGGINPIPPNRVHGLLGKANELKECMKFNNPNETHYPLPPISFNRPNERWSKTRSATARGHGVEVNGSSTDRVRTKMSSIYRSSVEDANGFL